MVLSRHHRGNKRPKSRYVASICTAAFLWTLIITLSIIIRAPKNRSNDPVKPTALDSPPPGGRHRLIEGLNIQAGAGSKRKARPASSPPPSPPFKLRKFYNYGAYLDSADSGCTVPWVRTS